MGAWSQLHRLASTPSTNDLALRAATTPAPAWSVWMAEHQTSGRGRRGPASRKTWVEHPGTSILMSILLRPRIPAEIAPALTLVAGVSFARALRDKTGAQVKLKWPNDLLLGGKKLGGILTESTTDVEQKLAVVIGVGINVNEPADHLPAPVRMRATSLLSHTGQNWDRTPLASSLVAALREDVALFEAHQGLGPLRQRWCDLAILGGQRVRLIHSGQEGAAVDLFEDGSLMVDLNNGDRVPVRSGDVIFL